MNITINEVNYEVKYNLRALMIYENLTGESFKPNGLNSMVTLFYSCIMAANKNSVILYDDFIDVLDEQQDKLNEFCEYVVSMISKNNQLSEKEKEDEPKKKVKRIVVKK